MESPIQIKDREEIAVYQGDDTVTFVGDQWLDRIDPKTNPHRKSQTNKAIAHHLYRRPRGPPPPNKQPRPPAIPQQSTANQQSSRTLSSIDRMNYECFI